MCLPVLAAAVHGVYSTLRTRRLEHCKRCPHTSPVCRERSSAKFVTRRETSSFFTWSMTTVRHMTKTCETIDSDGTGHERHSPRNLTLHVCDLSCWISEQKTRKRRRSSQRRCFRMCVVSLGCRVPFCPVRVTSSQTLARCSAGPDTRTSWGNPEAIRGCGLADTILVDGDLRMG
jgi:hypothetical protein